LNTASIDIDSLDEKMRNFVIKYEQGSREASDLVSKEALKVRETIIRESGKTEMAIRDHVTQTSAKAEHRFQHHVEQASRERSRERLLQSLKYPSMNERANQIEDAHTDTFCWLFADGDNLSDSNDEACAGDSQALANRNLHSQYDFSHDSSDDKYIAEPPGMVWDSFTDWLQSDLSIYWIMGKPGSGKSTLARFILSEPRTKILLEKWRRDVIIASHYFWRPGAPMQRNIKGMLCSIAHQLVFVIPNASEYASRNVDRLNSKDTNTDWSVKELQRLCLGLIRHFGKPLCLLIDGLDECGPEDEHQDLLETLETIRLQNVKIIASSRNEAVFERRFRHEPQLRIQDLTAGDLHTYATDKLRQQIRNEPFFCKDLVKKAEGVFLWLTLAVQSINRGLDNGESLTEIRKRMESLPQRLNDLYKDMWERLNDDCDIYRESAALYFRLTMAAHDKDLECLKQGLSVMEMMLASAAQPYYTFATSPVISASQLLEECEGFRKRVEVRCAGLLCVYGEPAGCDQDSLRYTEIALLENANKRAGFRFVHRSAHDFLADTVEGQSILRHNGMSSEDLNLCVISASLGAVKLIWLVLGKATKSLEAHSWCLVQNVETYLHDLARIADARDSAARALFSVCYELYNSSCLLIVVYPAPRTIRIAAFFGIAAYYPILDRYSMPIIENELVGRGIRSAILLAVAGTQVGEFQHFGIGIPLKLAQWLIHLPDIDVNMKHPLWALDIDGMLVGEEIGPLEHIKTSPFTRLLGLGLGQLHFGSSSRHMQPLTASFLRLVSDFALKGADFHSTIFLVCSEFGSWSMRKMSDESRLASFSQMPGFMERDWPRDECDQIFCVVALQATTVIQRLLASLLKTDLSHDILDEDEHSSNGGDESASSDLENAVSYLYQRCQEDGCSTHDRVVGFLQPCGNFADMPYRQVSDQDSTSLMEMIWTCILEHKMRSEALWARLREVIARSPFSSIGFRDYLRDMGCFDEHAGYRMQLEYEEGMVTPTESIHIRIMTVADGRPQFSESRP
jgi:hypothetical protein